MASAGQSLRLYFVLSFAILGGIFLFLPCDAVSPQSRDYHYQSLIRGPVEAENTWSEHAHIPPAASGDIPAIFPAAVEKPLDRGNLATRNTPAGLARAPGDDADGYETDKIFFELDLTDYHMPNIDVRSLRKRPAHNYKGAGNPTFALFFMSRNSSLQDPYFLATHEVIYRLIWKEDTKSMRHPVTVFVPPWVDDLQRSWFQAIGALVREVGERPFHPDQQEVGGLISHRFRDVFSKLDMWSHIEFTRILFLDSDAFPLVNVDALLEKDMSPEQQCVPPLMFKDYPLIGSDSTLCQYVFTGAQDLVVGYMTNVGVMVIKPNRAMHDLLISQYQNTSQFHDGFVEQAFLSHIFREDGPFPVHRIDKAWNGDPEVRDSGHDLYIVHAKLWAVMFEDPNHWAGRLFFDTWTNLTSFYESPEFQRLRVEDGQQYGLQQTR